MAGEHPGEAQCLAAIALGECLPQWYLSCGYAYEALDFSVVSDATFDALCRALDAEWELQVHPHLALIDRGAVRAGSAVGVSASAPAIARSCAERWAHGKWP